VRCQILGESASGFGHNGDIERSLQAGFSEHLIKPIKLENPQAAIERALVEVARAIATLLHAHC
jgi:CheY-like chemotaxis protein